MELTITIIAIVFLIVVSGIFSGTEAAFLAASKAKLHNKAKEGHERANLVARLKDKMEKVISTLLVCNNLVNILASSLATGLFISLFGDSGVAYATAIMTVLIVIFAEVVPKFYAMRRAESYSMTVAPLLRVIMAIVKPATKVTEFISMGVLRMMGMKVTSASMLSSNVEELRGLIDMHRGDADAIEERAMLHSVLDLGDVDVEEVMVHRQDIKMLDLDASINDLISQLVESHHTRLPIYQGDQDNIVGIIHAKKFLRLIRDQQDNNRDISQDDILGCAKKPWFVPETTTLFEQLQAFRKRREHMALVVDEYGALQGIITLEDIIEEIVGDIDDEHDPNQTGFWQTQNLDVFAVGVTTIRDLNRHYDWDLSDDGAATIAGLLMHESRSIPKIGQNFRIDGFKIKVLRRLRNQITLVKITPPTVQADDDDTKDNKTENQPKSNLEN